MDSFVVMSLRDGHKHKELFLKKIGNFLGPIGKLNFREILLDKVF